MLEKLSLRAKVLIGNAIILLLLVLMGVVTYRSVTHLEQTNAWVDHTHNAIAESMRLEAAAIDMETGMRGYLLAGKEEFLAPYKGGSKRFERIAEGLKKRVSDNPAQVVLVEEIEETIAEWQSNVTEPAIAMRREIGDAKSMNDIGHLVREGKGKSFLDTFRRQIDTFIEREETLLEKRRKATDGSQTLGEYKKLMAWVTHTHEVISLATALQASAVDMETGMRGYLLSGQENFLEPYRDGSARFQSMSRELKALVSDNPVQVSLVEDIQGTIASWHTQVTQPFIQLRREVGDAMNMDDMARLVGEARGKTYFDHFRSQVATFRERENTLMAERQIAAHGSSETTKGTIVIGVLVATILCGFIAFGISNSITGPFQEIFRGLKAFSASELRALNQSFNTILSQLTENATRVQNASSEIGTASSHLTRLSASQAASVEQTSSSVQEIESMVISNVKAADESSKVSQQSGEKMEALSVAMEALSESNRKIKSLVRIISEIGSKTEIIGEIVFQTKLLSFNASVEAERAGEHGRGFAVVAQEVGNLAKMSGTANQEISKIVKESVSEAEAIAEENGNRVDAGLQLVSETRARTAEVAQSAAHIADASNQQARGVSEISKAIETLNSGTQNVASIAEQANTSSSSLDHAASDLLRVVGALNGFLRGGDGNGPSLLQPPSVPQRSVPLLPQVPNDYQSVNSGWPSVNEGDDSPAKDDLERWESI